MLIFRRVFSISFVMPLPNCFVRRAVGAGDKIKFVEAHLRYSENPTVMNIEDFDIWKMESINHECKMNKNIPDG